MVVDVIGGELGMLDIVAAIFERHGARLSDPGAFTGPIPHAA